MSKNLKIIPICTAIAAVIIVVVLIVMYFTQQKENDIQQQTYQITFNSSGGSKVEEQTITEGETIQKPQDPTKEGYIFIEWRYNGEPFDFSTKVEGNIILTAYYEEVGGESEEVEKFTIKFDTDGGSTISNQVIEKDSKITKPDNPTKKGYEFKGWFHNNEEFNFDTKISEDIELVAKWEKEPEEKEDSNDEDSNTSSTTSTVEKEQKKYTVTFDSNGGSSVSKKTVTEGKKVAKPSNPTRSGYTFTGWTLNGSTFDFNTAIKKNITLVANWKKVEQKKYTVTFNSNGGSTVPSQTVTEGKKATKPSNPTRTGYVFAGWTLNGNAYNFSTAVTKNITLVAKWTQNSYTIKASLENANDTFTTDRILTVYENGKAISFQAIKYTSGAVLCYGDNPVVMYGDIVDTNSYLVVLTDGTTVNATLN